VLRKVFEYVFWCNIMWIFTFLINNLKLHLGFPDKTYQVCQIRLPSYVPNVYIRITYKVFVLIVFQHVSKTVNSNYLSGLTRTMGILEDISTYMTDLAKFLLEWLIFETKIVVKIKTHILYAITFFRKSAIYEMWKNMVHPDRPPITIYGTCAFIKAT
jgi:hypothetical protein